MNKITDVFDVSIYNRYPASFKESLIQLLSRLVIIYMIVFASLYNFINSFNLFGNTAISQYETKIYLITFFIATIFSLLLFPVKNRNLFSIFIFLALLLLYIFVRFRKSEIFITLFERIDWLGKKTSSGRLNYSLTKAQIDNTNVIYIAMILVILAISFVIIWGIMHRYSIIVTIAIVIFPIVIPLIYGIEPSYVAIVIIVCAIMMLYSCQVESELLIYKDLKVHFIIKEKNKINYFELAHRNYCRRYLMQQSIIMALIMALILSSIGLYYKQSSYYNKDFVNKLSSNLHSFFEKAYNEITNKETNDIVMNDGNFKNAGNVSYEGKVILNVTVPKNVVFSSPIYLKGFVSKDYTKDGWEYDSSSKKYAFTTNGVDFIPAFMPSLYSALSNWYDYNVDNSTYQINVENLYSLNNRIFTTYNTGGISCNNASEINSTYDGEFYGISSEQSSTRLSYSLTCYKEDLVDIKNIALSNVSRYDTAEERISIMKNSNISYINDYMDVSSNYNYKNNELLYRKYVYNSYLNVSDAFKEFFNNNFTDILNGYTNSYYQNAIYSFYKTGDYEDICNIVRRYIQRDTSYTLTPGKTPDSEDFVIYFLQENRKGYCMHYASSATLLLRSMGVPARYVEGYVVNQNNIKSANNGTIQVYDSSAHAWVEIYVAGYGWVPVEFTPGYDNNGNNNPNDTSSTITSSQPTSSEDILSSDISSETNSDIESNINSDTTTSIVEKESNINNSNSFISFPRINTLLVIIIAVAILIVIIILIVLTGRIYMIKYREKVFNISNNNISAVNMFKYSLNLLSFYGFERNNNEPYIEYAKRVTQNANLKSCENFENISQIAMRSKFSQYKLKSTSLEEMRVFTENLSNEIYSTQSLWGKFKMKYIKRLI